MVVKGELERSSAVNQNEAIRQRNAFNSSVNSKSAAKPKPDRSLSSSAETAKMPWQVANYDKTTMPTGFSSEAEENNFCLNAEFKNAVSLSDTRDELYGNHSPENDKPSEILCTTQNDYRQIVSSTNSSPAVSARPSVTSPLTSVTSTTDFTRAFSAITRRSKDDDYSEIMRAFVGDHLAQIVDRIKTSSSYDLKETLLINLRNFLEETATVAQVRNVTKMNFYDALCDCMNVFMRRRSFYDQGLSAAIDVMKICAAQDKRFGSIMRKNDGIKILSNAAKHFLGPSAAPKRFMALVYIMRRLATSPRSVTIMWQNGTIKSFLITIFAAPTLSVAQTNSNQTATTVSQSSNRSSVMQNRVTSSQKNSSLSTGAPAVPNVRIIKELLNILITASKRSRALRPAIIEEIMRSMVRYLSTLRLPEDLKMRATSIRLSAIVVRNLLSTKVGRKTFRAFRGIEAVCAICDVTRSMVMVHLCGQILMAQKVPKRLPLPSHRHPCQVPLLIPGETQPVSNVEDVARIAALADYLGNTDGQRPIGAADENRFLPGGNSEVSSSEDDDEDIEPLRRQRYLVRQDDDDDDAVVEDDENENEDLDEADEEEFEEGDEEEEDDDSKANNNSQSAVKSDPSLTNVSGRQTELVAKQSSIDEIAANVKKDPYNYGANYDFSSIDVRTLEELTETYARFFCERNPDWPKSAHFDVFEKKSEEAKLNSVPTKTFISAPLNVPSSPESETNGSGCTNLVRQPLFVRTIFSNNCFNYVLPFQHTKTPTSDAELIPYAVQNRQIKQNISSSATNSDAVGDDNPSFLDEDERLHRGSLKGRKSILREDLLRLAEPKPLLNKVVYDLDSYFCDDGSCRVADDDAPQQIIADIIKPPTSVPIQERKNLPLQFSGLFECGNLRKAIQIREFEYDLLIEPDINNDRRIQWFYFSVANMLASVPYRFNIINCEKETSQFNEGQQPLMFSLKDRERGWHRAGSRVFYYRNMYRRNGKRNLPCRSTTFTLAFPHADDTCFIAYHFPYSYSILLYDLSRWTSLARDGSDIYIDTQPLTQSLCGNAVHIMTITSRNSCPQHERRHLQRDYVVLTGRVHPSESNASFIMRGCIDFLLSNHPAAKVLLERFIFKIIPMLNPDGVINGMTRGTMSTVDLNRTWVKPNKTLQPETYHTKGLLQYMCKILGVTPFMFLDLHGHSRMKNAFLYGCDPNQDWYAQMYVDCSLPSDVPGLLLREVEPDLKLFASTMSDICPAFSLASSSFKVTLIKEPSARVVVWRQLQCARSFTLESTFCGFDANNNNNIISPTNSKKKLCGRQINLRDLHTIGRDLMRALFKIAKWPTSMSESESKPLEKEGKIISAVQ